MRLFISILSCILFAGSAWSRPNPVRADSSRIAADLFMITQTDRPRSYEHVDMLDQVAAYIHSQFAMQSDRVEYQEFSAGGKTYRNVIASFGPEAGERIIIGAHYDVCDEQEGADDNASGVAGLLELARLLPSLQLRYRIDLVAYTLEEPPFFRTEQMGSYIHAKSLHDNNIPVKGMISLEMIGYFSDEKGSQDYPLGILSLFYGKRGDYITVVRKFGSGPFARKFKHKMKAQDHIKTKSFRAPAFLPGIDFSDHANYWQFGYSACMLTNTAFYRNPNYHQTTDTMETLDIGRMTKVIQGVFVAIGKIAEKKS